MNDHGLSATMKSALEIFCQASRGTGRSTALLERVKPGDAIVTATAQEARHLRDQLRQMNKPDVAVFQAAPRDMPLARLGTNPTGATYFDHLFIEARWGYMIDQVGGELAQWEAALSTRQPLREPAEPYDPVRVSDSEHHHRRF